MTPEPTPAAESGGAETAPPTVRRRPSLLRRVLTRLAADSNELQAEELQGQITASGASPIATCGDRERVCVAGTLRAVTFRPHGGAPALEAELWDGTASVTLIWLGRREIAGIHPGRRLRVHGRTTNLRGRRAIYNPAYELQATGAE